MITWRGDFVDAMKPLMYQWFFETYDAVPTVYDKVFNVKTVSGGAYEAQGNLQALGDLVEKAEGDDIVFEHVQQGRIKYLKYRTFAKGVEFTKEQVEDMPEWVAGQIQDYTRTWGESVRRTKEKFGANFFNYGGYTAGNDIFNNSTIMQSDPSGDLLYDGKPLFNLSGNTRTSLNGGTYYNAIALPLSVANLQSLYNIMTLTNNRNENDEKISIKPTTIIHNGSLRFTANQILLSTNLPGGANNDINPVQNLVTPLEWEYINTNTQWVLGVPRKGLEWRERQMPVLRFFQDPKNLNYAATIDARWGAAVTDWRFWAASNAPTS